MRQSFATNKSGFSFFGLVRRLLLRAKTKSNDGKSVDPVDAVRFSTSPTLQAPATEVAELDDSSTIPRVVVNTIGLYGSSGALPQHYTQHLLREENSSEGAPALQDFLDIFNHRSISMFYRAWEKNQPLAILEREGLDWADKEQGAIPRLALSHCGLWSPALRHALALGDDALLHFAGPLMARPRNAAGLERILSSYFDLPIRIFEFEPQWLQLDPAEQSTLGPEAQLGLNMVLGERVLDVQSCLRIRIGPLSQIDYQKFMPGGDKLRRLCGLATLYLRSHYDLRVQPVLRREEVTTTRFPYSDQEDSGVAPQKPPRLSQNVFLQSQPATRDFDEAFFMVSTSHIPPVTMS
ncbi:MAG: type VI secretion system baseplate subunit TssG [Planctomycetota bacterium]